MNVRAQLQPVAGGDAIEIVKDLTLVGRKEDCDVRLDHKSVSKLHCIIVKTDGLLLVRDLGSTNGTRVNGQRVRRAALLPNDKLTIAHFQFKVFLGPNLANIAPPAAQPEHTMAMSAEEAEVLLNRSAEMGDSEVELPVVPIKANVLPDVYPEDKKKKQ